MNLPLWSLETSLLCFGTGIQQFARRGLSDREHGAPALERTAPLSCRKPSDSLQTPSQTA